ncbi:MAG: C39 family peptidase, partial [Slackia sp.]
GLTGKTDYDPASMAAFSEVNGFVDSGMTAWSFMTEGAAMLGLSAEELPADASVLTAALREGRPVIASVLPGDFTTVGHFIVIAGVDETGNLIVHDPNSPSAAAEAGMSKTSSTNARTYGLTAHDKETYA